jgi:hypothetical protein
MQVSNDVEACLVPPVAKSLLLAFSTFSAALAHAVRKSKHDLYNSKPHHVSAQAASVLI